MTDRDQSGPTGRARSRDRASSRQDRRTRPSRETPAPSPVASPASAGLSPAIEMALLVAILAVSAFLCLWNLGSPRLWQDEAETALLGRNILKFGVPRVWDGENLVAQFYALDFDHRLLFQKSWLPSYLVAGSFALLGESTTAARLPFALFALLAIWLTWRLARRLTGDPATALTAALVLTLSLPFVLYARQCRWYGLAMALTLLLVEAEERIERRGGWIGFGAVLGALFHANYLICIATAAGLLVARAATRSPGRLLDRRLVAGLALGAALALPHLIAFPPFGEAKGASDLVAILYGAAWATGDLNRYVLPIPGLAVLLAWRGRGLLGQGWFVRFAILLAVALLATSFTMWAGLVTIIGFRYVVNLLPIAAILTASVLRAAAGARQIVFAGLVAAQLATHVLGFPLSLWPPVARPHFVKQDLFDAFRSVLAPMPGPIDGAVEFLAKNARPGEYLFTPYEALSIQFYTRLRTTGMQTVGETLRGLGVTLPSYVSTVHPDQLDWLLPRRSWEKFSGAPGTDEILAVERERGRPAQRTILTVPDLPWQTREYPPMRVFIDDPAMPRTILYRFPPSRATSP